MNNKYLQKVILAGNPNVGKSVIFNKLTGLYAEVSNYPGTTVDISKAVVDDFEFIDTPGIYGLGSFNEEEIVAKEIILKADIIINVISALSLERDLFLTQQLIDMGFKILVVLNQTDEAASRGICIDIDKLENHLGVVIISTIAIKSQGIDKVKENIENAKFGNKVNYPDNLTSKMILELEEDPDTRECIYLERRKRINIIVEDVLSITNQGLGLSAKLGKLLLNPIIGFFALLLILFILYKVIGVFIAGNVVNFLEKEILFKYYIPWISNIVSTFVSNSIIKEILSGEFGLLTMTIQYIIGILLPLIIGFNLFMAFLEDSGYLPRLAVLVDRSLSKIGLNGKAIIPIVLGFGCVTMATISTRILGSKRERTIATVLLGLVIPCSAQLGIIIGLISLAGGLKAWIVYIFSMLVILLITGSLLNKVLPGKSTHLLIDLPPMRFPVIKNILNKTFSKTKHFLEEATPLFFLGAFIVTIMKLSGILSFIQKVLAPFTVNILHLPPEAATIFLMGVIRRDFGAAGLAKLAGIGENTTVLTPLQIVVSLVVITLFVPCIASVMIMFKERGWKEASLVWFGSWVVAFTAGGILTRILWGIF